MSALERRPDSVAQQAALTETLAETPGAVDDELVAAAKAVVDAVAEQAPAVGPAIGVDLERVRGGVPAGRIGALGGHRGPGARRGIRRRDRHRPGRGRPGRPRRRWRGPFVAVGQPSPTASGAGRALASVLLQGVHAGGDIVIGGAARRAEAVLWSVRPDPDADERLVGRDTELGILLGLLNPSSTAEQTDGGPARAGSAVVVSAVVGAPGVGKSELALAAARLALHRGWFGDRVFAVDLQGYAEDPDARVMPAQLYPGLLRALGVGRDQVPPQTSEQAAAYHQVLAALADATRPVLLVLDNASDSGQVIPVMPRGIQHRVLVTSRDSLAELPAVRLIDLAVLAPAAAVELLEARLRARAPNDDRLGREPQAAARIAGLCGYLPLALSIVAALLAEEADRSIGHLAEELADETTRLEAMSYSAQWAVRAAFKLSYRRLDAPTAALFGQLSAIPGPDLGLAAATAAADRPTPQVRAGLRALARAHLLEPDPGGQRWRFHDLIRLYAAEQLPTPDRLQVFEQVLGWYRDTAYVAHQRFTALPGELVPDGFDTPAQARAWVAGEQPGLVATVIRAATRQPMEALWLALHVMPFLERSRSLQDWVTTAEATTGITEDPHTAAAAWNNLGNALQQVRRFDDAITALDEARHLYQDLGDRHREAGSGDNLGNAFYEVGRFDDAITAHQQARDVFQELGDRHGEAHALNNLGNALQRIARYDEAITVLWQARNISQELGDRHGEGMACINLGNALIGANRGNKAITAIEQACHLLQELGDRHGEAQAWESLGNALLQMARYDEAIAAHQQARDIHQEFGDGYREAGSWTNLGNALNGLGRFDDAITAHQQALDMYHEHGDRHSEGTAWNNLGNALYGAGRGIEAIPAYEQACDLLRDVSDRHAKARALSNLGNALQEVLRFGDAITAHQLALDTFKELADRYGEARAWNNLGNAHYDVGRLDDAITAHQHARDILQELGDRYGESAAWNNLGRALQKALRFDEAITAHGRDLAICNELGDVFGKAQTLANLGSAHHLAGAVETAREVWVRARNQYRRAGDEEGAHWVQVKRLFRKRSAGEGVSDRSAGVVSLR